MGRILRGVALALGLVTATAEAAELVPVIVDPTGQFAIEGVAGRIDNALVYDRGAAVSGTPGEWPLGDFRMTLPTAAATMSADIDERSIRIDTTAALRDAVPGNLSAPEANPQVGDIWFYVAPDPGEAMGTPVDFHLALEWHTMTTDGAIPDSTATAVLSNATNSRVAPALTSTSDSERAEVMIGEYYRVGLYHDNLVRDGLLVSSATLYAGLAPSPSLDKPAPALPGDYNADGTVNAADYTLVRDAIGGPYRFELDGNGDGTIDEDDLTVLRAWYGSEVPAIAAVAVPEPSAAVLLAIVFGASLGTRRNKETTVG